VVEEGLLDLICQLMGEQDPLLALRKAKSAKYVVLEEVIKEIMDYEPCISDFKLSGHCV
jgi:hypothetical protein